jgi:oligoribonuclease
VTKYCPVCEVPLSITDGYGFCTCCGWNGPAKDTLTEPRPAKVKMPYLSIDIETTGLNPETCQILEVGAVYDDWARPVSQLPTFSRYITHRNIVGEPYALSMHGAILRQIAQPNRETCCSPEDFTDVFIGWLLDACGWDRSKSLTPAGKNFASFDRPFLERLPGFKKRVRLHHRTLDPTTLFWKADDEKLPDSKQCMERAGIPGEVAHTALEDAVAVVKLIRHAAKCRF